MILDYLKLETPLVQLISSEEAYHFNIVPKSFDDNVISFYIDNRFAENIEFIAKDLELIHGKNIVLEPLDNRILQKTLSVHYRNLGNNSASKSMDKSDLIEDIIEKAVLSKASDIHLEVFREFMRVRYRIDGVLIEMMQLGKERYGELINQVKIKSNLNITEKRLPQDGRIQLDEFDIRISVLPTQYGEKIVMRLLPRNQLKLDLKKLGFSSEDLNIYYENVNKSNGIILISGPTGSGKTTTLYATLEYLNDISRNILTVEDPVEYSLTGINQVQVNEEIGLTFPEALRSFLRQDPDVIMLGEIRDAETAQMAIRAALTGHLVLSTIHTNSAIGTLSRLEEMGVPEYLISDTLNLSIAQRLVRLLCEKCKKKINKAIPSMLLSILSENEDMDLNISYGSVGCNNCHYTGYSGRVAVYELLPVNQDTIKHLKSAEIKERIIIKTLREQAIKLVVDGKTSIEEVYPILINQR